ncbi:hypothetical protein [Methylorubrum extorquens]
MSPVRAHTVAHWIADGYRGLRVMRCPACGEETFQTWEQLRARLHEDVVVVAQRIRCGECHQPPAGLAVVTYKDVA